MMAAFSLRTMGITAFKSGSQKDDERCVGVLLSLASMAPVSGDLLNLSKNMMSSFPDCLEHDAQTGRIIKIIPGDSFRNSL